VRGVEVNERGVANGVAHGGLAAFLVAAELARLVATVRERVPRVGVGEAEQVERVLDEEAEEVARDDQC